MLALHLAPLTCYAFPRNPQMELLISVRGLLGVSIAAASLLYLLRGYAVGTVSEASMGRVAEGRDLDRGQ